MPYLPWSTMFLSALIDLKMQPRTSQSIRVVLYFILSATDLKTSLAPLLYFAANLLRYTQRNSWRLYNWESRHWAHSIFLLARSVSTARYSRLPITRTFANSNYQTRFPLDFLYTFTIILPSIGNSNARYLKPPANSNIFCFPSGIFYIILCQPCILFWSILLVIFSLFHVCTWRFTRA